LAVPKTIGRIIVFVLLCTNAFAQNYLEFIENKGQWDKQIRFKGEMSAGSFALQPTGYRVLLYDKKDLSHVSESLHGHAAPSRNQVNSSSGVNEPAPEGGNGGAADILHCHVYEMRFLNANKDPMIVPDKPVAGYSNYFIGNDSSKWASNCRTFQAVTYKDVYPGIDVHYYTANGLLKYDFIVQPGADVSNIAMYFDGVESLKVRDGVLHVKTSVEDVRELAPYTYQLINDSRTEVPCSYEVKGNIVRFKLGSAYTKTSTLIIDPSIVFFTYTGSMADNWGYTATYDGKGNFYAGGIAFSSGFPTSNGAFQEGFQGGNTLTGDYRGFDMGIMKFDPTGANRIYATYIGGGAGNEQPHSLIVDAAGNLIIAGRSSSSDYPTKGALRAYGPLGGRWDMVVTKLNASGSALVASVKIGGSGDDGVNIRNKYPVSGLESINRNYGDDARSEVILDGAGNIYVASCTQSPDFPTTAVSNQKTLAGTNGKGRAQDAVVLKLAPDLSSVLFSVLIGGTDDDAAFVLAINPTNNNLFVAGATASNDFPGNKVGVKFPAFQGGTCDGFVAEFTSNGVLVRDGYFGTSGADIIYGIQFDKFGFLYISGTTTSAWPIINANFNQPGGKQFIAKLKPDLSDYIYSTAFGTGSSSPNISPTAFLVDRCENVYVSGWGGSTNTIENYPTGGTTGLPITPDAYQKTTDNSDFYFFVLEKNAQSQLYGSFFGQNGGFGDHVDGGTSRFDRNGVIYQAICANCGTPKPSFPGTPGVWSPQNNAQDGGCNLAAIKIAFNLAGVGAGLQASIGGIPRDTAGCVPLAVDFKDTLAQGKQYKWDFDDGTKVTTTVPSVSHTFNTVGLYRVQLVSVDSSTCNISDTAWVTMRVRNDRATLSFATIKLQPCTSLAYQFTNTSTAIKPFSAASFKWDFGDGSSQLAGSGAVTHAYAAGGTYDVKLILIDTSYCNEPDSLIKQIRISTTVKAQFQTSPFGCVPYTAIFKNTSLGGIQFLWDFGDGTSSTATEPTHLYNTVGTYQIRLIATDTASCNKIDTSAYFAVKVSPNPKSAFSYSPQPPQPNTAVSFLNSAIGATRYKWLFGDRDTLFTISPDTVVQHLYNASGAYNACLVGYNDFGCSDTSCQTIRITIINGLDVANAFSPNGDGRNDKIYVRGFGIAKMTWSIYNRWGTLVYIGTNQAEGWDGTYKGVLQPQDVYHYTLLVEFSSKDRATKKGDITLLR
jgi:gliding motility-associated-like protein